MNPIRIRLARPIAAELHVPGDRSISHRALLLAALSNGECRISGFLPAAECLTTLEACRAFGAEVLAENAAPAESEDDEAEASAGPVRLIVRGVRMRLVEPPGPIDCGSFATPLALLMGLFAGQPFPTQLMADSKGAEAAQPVIDLLQPMGVRVSTSGPVNARHYTVHGTPRLRGASGRLPVTSARIKGAGLFAGMAAAGRTILAETAHTRDHTERMMQYFLVKTLRRGDTLTIYGGQVPESRDFHIPGDVSSAAVWITTAAIQPGAELVVRDVGLNETRTAFLRILVRMGAQVAEDVQEWRFGEPWGHITVRGVPLKATSIAAAEATQMIDELPLLAVAAALADGQTVIRVAAGSPAAQLLVGVCGNLRRMGVTVEENGEGCRITGNGFRAPLRSAELNAAGDHRLAMAGAVAGLFADGETVLEHADCVEDAYPGFARDLARFQTKSISSDLVTPVISALPSLRRPEDAATVHRS